MVSSRWVSFFHGAKKPRTLSFSVAGEDRRSQDRGRFILAMMMIVGIAIVAVVVILLLCVLLPSILALIIFLTFWGRRWWGRCSLFFRPPR